MSSENIKTIVINVKELVFKSEQIIVDLTRYLAEALPQIDIARKANELVVNAPNSMSKRAIRLRIKKFLYKKSLSDDYRPISFKDAEKNGYMIKEKKVAELVYY